jgi:hypothetical protein
MGKLKPGLKYIRSKWLNPLFLVMLTRTQNLEHVSSEVVLAQVWRIDDTKKSNDACDSSAILVSELKQPLGEGDLMRERSHATFSVGRYSSLDASAKNGDAARLSMKRMTSFVTDCECISYHRDTDCLTLCTLGVASASSSA